ncbi:MAG: flavodoxin [Clostridia bacterium]|nr:flavodoxin [Clostridia bacterium]
MKTAIVYYSEHHGNTKKLLDAIAAKHDVTLISVTNPQETDLTGYDRIGLASGIYYNSYAKQLLAYAQEHLPEGREVFYIFTHGAPKGTFLTAVRRIAEAKRCREAGSYHCRGFDTFGPFKLTGGIAKGHPTEEEISGAVSFYEGL